MELSEEQTIFQIILHSGNSRAESYKAIKEAREGNFTLARKHWRNPEKNLIEHIKYIEKYWKIQKKSHLLRHFLWYMEKTTL